MIPEATWIGLLILMISFVLHEWGHIVIMQRLKIFKGLKWHWWGLECVVDKSVDVEISLVQGINVYLVGFIFSLFPVPIWYLTGGSILFFIVFNAVCSIWDFYYMFRMLFKFISFNENEGMVE